MCGSGQQLALLPGWQSGRQWRAQALELSMQMLRLGQQAAGAETAKRPAEAPSQAGQSLVGLNQHLCCTPRHVLKPTACRQLVAYLQKLTSAPRPKRKPSEKRVDAFTLTHAESTHLRNSSATSGSSAAHIAESGWQAAQPDIDGAHTAQALW